MPAPGWYPDPQASEQLRWWDGRVWTANTQPRVVAPMQPTPLVTEYTTVLEDLTKCRAQCVALQAELSESAVENRRLARRIEQLETENNGLRENTARSVDTANQHEPAAKSAELELLSEQIARAKTELIDVTTQIELQDVGFFEYEHPAEHSMKLAGQLEAVRQHIKQMLRDKTATQAVTSFTFNGSLAQGRRFVDQMSRVLLRAYDAEAENCVKTVKAGNLSTAQARLRKAADQIAQNGTMIDLHIVPEYHQLRMEELELAARHLTARQVERELERERRAELREEEKARRELEAERAKLAKERAHYLNTIASLRERGDEEGIQRMQERLDDVEGRMTNVDYRMANTRAGHVYVISNLGAFGDRMVKIGMTRRLEPMDRVRELGDASVPFRFDTHALFFADDAVTVENLLHKAFEDRRVNNVNLRREFFYATPAEVRAVIDTQLKDQVEVVEFIEAAPAEEYRLSRASASAH
ncbi:DUF4041 domain-containing protein [Gordonia sp. NPDC003429]